jgi:hypothetical protein
VPCVHDVLGSLVLHCVQATARNVIFHSVQEFQTKCDGIICSKNCRFYNVF